MRNDSGRAISMAITLLAVAILVGCAGTDATDAPDSEEPSAGSTTPSAGAQSAAAAESEAASGAPEETSGGPLGDAASCVNDEFRFTVDYPGDWWANERVEPDTATGTPIPACTYFAPEPVELRPNTGLPRGITIWFDQETQFEVTGEVLSSQETTVDGRSAFVVEAESTGGGFEPEGTRTYRYIIDMGEGSEILVTTSTQYVDEAEYEEAKPILDAMMETLDFDD